MARLILEIGHGPSNTKRGQYDPGAISGAHKEHTIVARIASDLEYAHPKHIVVAPDDRPLREVIAWINEQVEPGDILFSLHMNSGPAKAEGAEVLYAATVPQRADDAARLAASYCRWSGLKNRGAKPDTSSQHPRLAVLRDTKCPAFLWELGFINNPKDVQRVISRGGSSVLQAYRDVFGWHDEFVTGGVETDVDSLRTDARLTIRRKP